MSLETTLIEALRAIKAQILLGKTKGGNTELTGAVEMSILAGKADNAKVSQIVKEMLGA